MPAAINVNLTGPGPRRVRERRDRTWLRTALVFGHSMSKDPEHKVGAAVVAADDRAVSLGFNGLPAHMPETDEAWAGPLKGELVVHAEVNAVLNAPFDTWGSTCYATWKPCHRCLGVLANAGVRRVVWLRSPLRWNREDAAMFDAVMGGCGLAGESLPYTSVEFDMLLAFGHAMEDARQFYLSAKEGD